MSNHSQIALNKFINITNPYVLCINETKKDITSDKFDNYTVVSAINGNNSQGVAMLKHSSLPYLRIYDLENIHFDSIWILTVLNGKKVVIGTAYIQPNSPEKMQHFINSLGILKSYCISKLLDGGIFIGDCNARNVAWGDNTDNLHGTLLEDYIVTDFAILIGPEPTFLAKNGSSVIDLIICCGSVCDIPHRSSVDKDVELFSGAPNRGHIPVTVEFESVSEAITTKSKPWIEKADWDNWSLFLEQNSYSVPSNQADELWIFTKSLHASQYFIPSKTVSKHSKPFWNTKLEEASKSLREARRKFKRSSNYSNGEDLKEKRELFKDLLSESASLWIRNQLEQLGHKKGREFWKCHKRLFKDKFENIGIVRNKNGELLCDPMSISQEFRKTFFEGRHLETISMTGNQLLITLYLSYVMNLTVILVWSN